MASFQCQFVKSCSPCSTREIMLIPLGGLKNAARWVGGSGMGGGTERAVQTQEAT